MESRTGTALKALAYIAIVLLGLVGRDASDSTAFDPAGRWRTLAVTDPQWLGPVGWELELRPDGTFRELVGNRLGVKEDGEGTWRLEEGRLSLEDSMVLSAFDCRREGNLLVLEVEVFEGYRIVLERSELPIESLHARPGLPRTVEEAVDTLLAVLKAETVETIREMDAAERGGMHFGLGLCIRNGFGLWRGNEELLDSCGNRHPDSASDVILKALWNRLHAEPRDQ